MFGSRKKSDTRIASCWVFAIVEISSPTPSGVTRNRAQQASRSGTDPLIGTWKSRTPRIRISMVSMKASRTYGASLPTSSSHERIGVTINCSIVPRSRSRTMAVDVSTTHRNSMMIPISAGTM